MASHTVLAGTRPTKAPELRIADLHDLTSGQLEPLLREQTIEWANELEWDFSNLAALLHDLASAQKLFGLALLDDGEVAGYGYCGFAAGKGHIGDIFIRPRWRNHDTEERLFWLLFHALKETPGVHRIESQLMLAHAMQAPQEHAQVQRFERLFMLLDGIAPFPQGNASVSNFRLEPWTSGLLESAAIPLWQSHIGHVDAQISAQYRTPDASRRFIDELIHFPGCARFHAPASFVAFDRSTGQPAGMLLSSFVADGVAHIAELCVGPQFRGIGLGYELFRRSAAALQQAGARKISLTVTVVNEDALRLYRRCGFSEIRRFYAYAWDREPSVFC